MNRKLLAMVLALLAGLVLLAGGPALIAHAAFPGANGRIVFHGGERYGNHDIYVMNADGSGRTRLTVNASAETSPAWSPDGTKIAFVSYRDGNGEIYVMNADGSGQTRLTYDNDLNQGPAWSPDGRRIVFTIYRSSTHEVWIMNADGSDQTALISNAAGAWAPAWSPDGTKIAFELYEGGTYNIYVINVDGTGQTQLANGDDPNWSPDGTKIAFRGYRNSEKPDILIMNADGSDQVNLTNDDYSDAYPAWSPDGKQVVYSSRHGDNVEIFVINADGSELTQLTTDPGDDYTPDWQPLPPETFKFTPTNDAYVLSSRKNTVYNRPRLQVKDAAADMNTYVKFNVTGLTGTVQRATLRLWVQDPGQDGGKVFATSPYYKNATDLWLETNLKWRNAPTISGPPLAMLGKVFKNRWVEVDVTHAVIDGLANNNGRVSFALASDSRNLVAYSSKEGAHPPELVVAITP